MKFIVLVGLFLFNQAFASITVIKDLKIDRGWKIKFDPSEWSYLYLKPMNGISPHIFENKKENFKLILQRETHTEDQKNIHSLVQSKCAEANLFYAKNKSGSANVETINGVKTCYIQYKNVQGKRVHEFVYPEISRASKIKNYELYTYVWNSESSSSKDSVMKFLQGFVK